MGEHLGYGGKQDIVFGADRAVAQGLSDMAFAGTAWADNEHADFFFDKPAGGQIDNQTAVDVGIEGEVELFQGFLISEVGPAKSGLKCSTNMAFLAPGFFSGPIFGWCFFAVRVTGSLLAVVFSF